MHDDHDDDDDGRDDGDDEVPTERAKDPVQRVREQADGFRMHAELAAIYEGPRKFDAQLTRLDAALAREIQQAVGKLAQAREPETPVLPKRVWPAAMEVLVGLPESRELATNDYHVLRRPGEVMIVRWLAGDEVEAFYERMQAHFEAALEQCRETERNNLAWRENDAATQAYLDALDKLEFRMADRYLRDAIKQHKLFVCSTLAADEIHIGFLCDHLMGVGIEELVGPANAPPAAASEQELAWFYKLFAIRGLSAEGEERMCFFTYLQKTDEDPFDLE